MYQIDEMNRSARVDPCGFGPAEPVARWLAVGYVRLCVERVGIRQVVLLEVDVISEYVRSGTNGSSSERSCQKDVFRPNGLAWLVVVPDGTLSSLGFASDDA